MLRNLAPVLVFAALAACAAEPPPASVSIQAPAHGASLAEDSLRVVVSAAGIDIVPADGLMTPGRAHHHFFLDLDLTPAGQPIPAGVPGITHLGTGDSVALLSGLTPGRHRLIAVLAHGNHVPLQPWTVDTLFFTVEPQ
jgi:hypothetical protein